MRNIRHRVTSQKVEVRLPAQKTAITQNNPIKNCTLKIKYASKTGGQRNRKGKPNSKCRFKRSYTARHLPNARANQHTCTAVDAGDKKILRRWENPKRVHV